MAAVLLLLFGLLALRWRRGVVAVPLILAAAACTLAAFRVLGVQAGPLDDLAGEQAVVTGTATVVMDPLLRSGKFGNYVLVHVGVTQMTGRGQTYRVRSPVLVIAEVAWRRVVPGEVVRFSGRLDRADGPELAGMLIARGPPVVIGQPGPVGAAVNNLRAGLRAAVAGLPPGERALVPALVNGDDTNMPPELAENFRTTGLTHLLAVSGANLTLVLAFLLPVGRYCGVRGRGLLVLGMLGVVGFVLLARPQPSVLRAAAMGVVALTGLAAGGRRRGMRAICAAVLVLVLVDPWLARSVGFLLSVLATTGILLLAPLWRDQLSRWLPRVFAEAIAVPLSAQVVCTPVVAALSSQVSIVAVVANLLAAPAVGPATVLGVVATLVAVVSDRLAAVVGWLAGRAAWWIITVAERGAALPGADVPWPATPAALLGLTGLCVLVMVLLPSLLRRPAWCLAVVLTSGLLVSRPLPSLGWPPQDWLLVACDVGQGDALVLNAGDRGAVVVDTGPEPASVDRCLDRLGVSAVPVVMLTHLHADHADGLTGVLAGRSVGEVVVGGSGAEWDLDEVGTAAAAAGVPVRRTALGEQHSVGPLSWTVLSPPSSLSPATAAEESAENNASVVMLVQAHGRRLLLTGDIEPEAQQALLGLGVDLDVDLLKVPHHGSAYQDDGFIAATSPEVAVVSAGEDNDYGHPAPSTLRLLRSLGTAVFRTDLHGDVAVVVAPDGGLAVATR